MIRWFVLGLLLLEWLLTSRLLQRKGEQLDRHTHPEYLKRSEYVQGSGNPPGSGGEPHIWRGVCDSNDEVAILPHVSGVTTFGITAALERNMSTGAVNARTSFGGGGPGTDIDLGNVTVWVTAAGGTITIQRNGGSTKFEVVFVYLWV